MKFKNLNINNNHKPLFTQTVGSVLNNENQAGNYYMDLHKAHQSLLGDAEQRLPKKKVKGTFTHTNLGVVEYEYEPKASFFEKLLRKYKMDGRVYRPNSNRNHLVYDATKSIKLNDLFMRNFVSFIDKGYNVHESLEASFFTTHAEWVAHVMMPNTAYRLAVATVKYMEATRKYRIVKDDDFRNIATFLISTIIASITYDQANNFKQLPEEAAFIDWSKTVEGEPSETFGELMKYTIDTWTRIQSDMNVWLEITQYKHEPLSAFELTSLINRAKEGKPWAVVKAALILTGLCTEEEVLVSPFEVFNVFDDPYPLVCHE